MPITASAPIAVGDNTTTVIALPYEVDKILATVVFYDDAAGDEANMAPAPARSPCRGSTGSTRRSAP